MDLVVIGIISTLLFLFLHYFPFHWILGQKPEPPLTYVAGVLFLAAPYVGWLAWQRLTPAIWAGVVVVVCGGGATLLAYGVDAVFEGKKAKADLADAEATLERRR